MNEPRILRGAEIRICKDCQTMKTREEICVNCDLKPKIEHCSEPNCPECNLQAYNKGREDMRNEIIEKNKTGIERCNNYIKELESKLSAFTKE